jgi:hypothetical protein
MVFGLLVTLQSPKLPGWSEAFVDESDPPQAARTNASTAALPAHRVRLRDTDIGALPSNGPAGIG